MTKRIVINTGPLISLCRMEAFDLIARLPFDFIAPAEVEAEILAGAKEGFDLEIPHWLKSARLNYPVSALAAASLDAGEAAVIQLALEQNISLVCIDEIKGRRAAMAVGLEVVGSLGLMGKCKSLGLTDQLAPFLKKAKTSGIYYDDALIEIFLKPLGETWR